MNEPFDQFEDEDWNKVREGYEDAVVKAVYDLSNYMGCNSFTLPTGLMKVKVLITSEQVDALLN